MPLNLSMPELTELKPRISVIGVGGAGGNAVNNMIESSLEGVEFVVANTDAQALGLSKAMKRIQLGVKRTQGLGAGSLPDVGRGAAEESLEEILELVGNSHMLFITAGMGGGTGTGAAPVIAKAAKERGILTVGVVTKPFHFEGQRRMRVALAGIDALQEHVDTLLIIPNQNLFSIANERTTFHEAFAMADQVLHSGVRGITDLMVMPGLINLDFNDVRTVMSEMGKAMMGTGEAEGDKRAILAAEAAISNPLLDEVSMKGARGVLINITGSLDMTLFEVDEAANRIRSEVDPEANIIVGSTFNQDLEGRVRVSVVATGIEAVEQVQSDPRTAGVVAQAQQKPWRDPATERPAPITVRSPLPPISPPLRTPASPVASNPVQPPRVPEAPATGVAASLPPQPASSNRVGEIHDRIRVMLLGEEGTSGAVRGQPPEVAPAPLPPTPRPQARNPFAEASRQGRVPGQASAPGLGHGIGHGLGAAFDAIKTTIGGAQRHDDERAPTAEPQPTARQPFAGDLFDESDVELEIPSFLRKKKIS